MGNARSSSRNYFLHRYRHLLFLWTRRILKLKNIKSQFTIIQEEKLMTPEAEKFNGWMAMIGFVAAVGAYATTGQIIPGIF